MFTNADSALGNNDIRLENLIIDGNWKNQYKPDNETRVSFCNAVYFAKCVRCYFNNLKIINILQTALHFNRCRDIYIDKLSAEFLGWSGISTSGTDNIVATNIYIYDSGNDHRHSAVHLDGGAGCFIQGVIKKCVGNGVMLDSTFSDFHGAMVQVDASYCMRGVGSVHKSVSFP